MSAADVSTIVVAVAACLAAVTYALPRLTAAYQERTRAERVTSQTVASIVEAMRLSLESKIAEQGREIAELRSDHSACAVALATTSQELAELRAVNRGQEKRIVTLENALRASNDERDELARTHITGRHNIPREEPE